MTPAEKAKATREENKARKLHQEAIDRYCEAHDLRYRGVRFGVYQNNQTCPHCGATGHQLNIFRDASNNDAYACNGCVDGAK